jgi:ABC-type enterochelin transport system permease subunit
VKYDVYPLEVLLISISAIKHYGKYELRNSILNGNYVMSVGIDTFGGFFFFFLESLLSDRAYLR